MDRRLFLGCSCAAIASAACLAPAWGDVAFLPLKTPVRIPLDAVARTWAPALFKARFTKSDGLDSIVPGLAARTPNGLVVVCTYCPHELCVIRLDGPNLRCPCHYSLFDPQREGAWISGPALRNTYRFQYEVRATELVIAGVEADLERRLL